MISCYCNYVFLLLYFKISVIVIIMKLILGVNIASYIKKIIQYFRMFEVRESANFLNKLPPIVDYQYIFTEMAYVASCDAVMHQRTFTLRVHLVCILRWMLNFIRHDNWTLIRTHAYVCITVLGASTKIFCYTNRGQTSVNARAVIPMVQIPDPTKINKNS